MCRSSVVASVEDHGGLERVPSLVEPSSLGGVHRELEVQRSGGNQTLQHVKNLIQQTLNAPNGGLRISWSIYPGWGFVVRLANISQRGPGFDSVNLQSFSI